MKKILTAAALILAGMSAANAQTPQPADWTTITLTANLNRGADAALDLHPLWIARRTASIGTIATRRICYKSIKDV